MAKSQQTFNKLEREKNKAKKREEKRKKMQARKEARERGDLKQDEFVYVDHLGNFTDTPPDPAEKEEISLESINLGAAKNQGNDDPILPINRQNYHCYHSHPFQNNCLNHIMQS